VTARTPLVLRSEPLGMQWRRGDNQFRHLEHVAAWPVQRPPTASPSNRAAGGINEVRHFAACGLRATA